MILEICFGYGYIYIYSIRIMYFLRIFNMYLIRILMVHIFDLGFLMHIFDEGFIDLCI